MEHQCIEEDYSVDRWMVPYTGTRGCKQYIYGKTHPLRYKLWVGTTRTDYINWFKPYQGASSNVSQTYKDLGVGASIVLEYADVLRSKWPPSKFHLFFDNFFTSIGPIYSLTKKNLYRTDTIR
ncbi:hypothetical protein ILUMI_07909 [Ignelater luminosus]|uniref:PiggyBac transposable element-derived protein domain-containing protein n=1 Tax=Ignelater luminosus TaxID=2038154 RepID=A0A8K0D2L6_IGNLU|nr:hypothetical protein ILUMI_07909 [Ignelater luminosus]